MARLLIVDDEVELTRNIASYLASFPGEFEATTVSSAEAAEAALAVEPVDLLLTDVRLPGLDGIELVRRALAQQPGLRVVVMTAFGSADMRSVALQAGAIRFVDKPLDLEELRHLLHEIHSGAAGWSGLVGGLEIFDLAQLLALSGKSKAIRATWGKERGVLVFEHGQVVHASTTSLEGEQAFFDMAGWEGGNFEEISPAKARKYPPNITRSTTNLMLEAVRHRDEARAGRGVEDVFVSESTLGEENQEASAVHGAGAVPHGRKGKERNMAIKEHLAQLQGVEGFMGAAVFASNGEMLEGLVTGSLDVKTVGMFANNALLNAQKATDQMGVGRGNLVQIRAPQATVIMRCLNEATDFAATSTGKAHFHTVVIMSPEGNVGMASMMLDKVVGKIADEVR